MRRADGCQGSLKRLSSQHLRLGPVGHPPSPPPGRTRVSKPPLKRVRQKSPAGCLWVSRPRGSPPPHQMLCSCSPLLRSLRSASRGSHRVPPEGKHTHKARTGCAQLLQVGRWLAEDKSHGGGGDCRVQPVQYQSREMSVRAQSHLH